MDVEASLAVGADIEDLSKAEFVGAVHAEVAGDEDDDASLDGSVLNIGVHVGVLDVFEAEGLYLFGDGFESFEGLSGVGHLAGLLVEVDESLSWFSGELHDFVVLFEEHVGDFGRLHLELNIS